MSVERSKGESVTPRKLLLAPEARSQRRQLHRILHRNFARFKLESERHYSARAEAIEKRSEYQELLPVISQLLGGVTKRWHGTGRFQYDAAGNIKDVFLSMLKAGGITPNEDEFDRSSGKKAIISTARSRKFSSLYALQNVPRGTELAYELGDRRWWATLFLKVNTIVALQEFPPTNEQVTQGSEMEAIARNVRAQIRRVTSKIVKGGCDSAIDAMAQGTTIDGKGGGPQNFPILIGIKDEIESKPNTAVWIGTFEDRTEQAIPVSSWSHVEVPEAHVADVKKMLCDAGYPDVLVIPIEYCEVYSRQFTLCELVSNNPLVPKIERDVCRAEQLLGSDRAMLRYIAFWGVHGVLGMGFNYGVKNRVVDTFDIDGFYRKLELCPFSFSGHFKMRIRLSPEELQKVITPDELRKIFDSLQQNGYCPDDLAIAVSFENKNPRKETASYQYTSAFARFFYAHDFFGVL